MQGFFFKFAANKINDSLNVGASEYYKAKICIYIVWVTCERRGMNIYYKSIFIYTGTVLLCYVYVIQELCGHKLTVSFKTLVTLIAILR